MIVFSSMKIQKFGLFIIILGASLFLLTNPSFATFSLSLFPSESGYDLSFGRVEVGRPKISKELRISITSDISKQYRVIQRVDVPLSNGEGYQINRSQFKMYTVINSNNKGTLERIEEMTVPYADTLLYTSNPSGDSDSFKVVYVMEADSNQTPGSYFGRLIFTLLPIDSPQEQVVKTINVYAELTNEGKFEIYTESGLKNIRISSNDFDNLGSPYSSVYAKVVGNLGTTYRIYQKLDDSLIKSESGQLFDLSSVKYYVLKEDESVPIKEGVLSDLRSKSLIYFSDSLGSGVKISINYEPLPKFKEAAAGRYRGLIHYFIETDKSITLTSGLEESLAIEFEIEPIFRIIVFSVEDKEVKSETVPVRLEFGEVGYKSGVRETKLKVKVQTNLGKPYLVTQRLSGPLQDRKGNYIPKEYFTFRLQKDKETGAQIKYTEESFVESDKDLPIFVSNSKGDSDEFEIIYRLKVTSDTRPGDYGTALSFSLTEL